MERIDVFEDVSYPVIKRGLCIYTLLARKIDLRGHILAILSNSLSMEEMIEDYDLNWRFHLVVVTLVIVILVKVI